MDFPPRFMVPPTRSVNSPPCFVVPPTRSMTPSPGYLRIAAEPSKVIDPGLKKFGALIGDFAEVGCNTVLNPGMIIGRESVVYPLTMVREIIPEEHILKNDGTLVPEKYKRSFSALYK